MTHHAPTAAVLIVALFIGHNAVAQASAGSASAPASASPFASAPASVSASASVPARPLSSAPAQDIRDIRGPKAVRSPWFIPLIVMTALLSGASVYATWTWYRGRQRPLPRTPSDIALARLDRARALMRPELARDFSIELSSIARTYIESRFRIMAAHLTTHEFLQSSLASPDPVLTVHRALLAEFLASCDLAKFGGWHLSISAMEAMWQSARRFIESTIESESAESVRTARTTPPATATTQSLTPRETYDSVPST